MTHAERAAYWAEVIAFVDEGHTRQEAAAHFDVQLRTVHEIYQKRGTLAAIAATASSPVAVENRKICSRRRRCKGCRQPTANKGGFCRVCLGRF